MIAAFVLRVARDASGAQELAHSVARLGIGILPAEGMTDAAEKVVSAANAQY